MSLQEISAKLRNSPTPQLLHPGSGAGGAGAGRRGGASGEAGQRRGSAQVTWVPADMAGSEPHRGSSSPQPHYSDWGRWEAAIRSGWRNFWQSVGKERGARSASREEAEEEPSPLTRLPVSTVGYGHRRVRPGGSPAPRPRPGAWPPPPAQGASGCSGCVVGGEQQLTRNALG